MDLNVLLLLSVWLVSSHALEDFPTSPNHVKAVAEKTWRTLSKYCNPQTLRCDDLPADADHSSWLVQGSSVADEVPMQDTVFNSTSEPVLQSEDPLWQSRITMDVTPGKKHPTPVDVDAVYRLCEYDIISTDCVPKSNFNQADVNRNVRWPAGRIPFVFRRNITDEDIMEPPTTRLRDAVLDAFLEIMAVTCVHFEETPDTTLIKSQDLVVISPRHRYASSIGRGPYQHLEILDQSDEMMLKNETHGEILHELMHILGFGHEHNRPDRDDHIWVNASNLEAGSLRYFKPTTVGRHAVIDLPYDLDSVTHFDSWKFASDPAFPTIIPKGGKPLIQRRKHLSAGDIAKINTLYECTDKSPARNAPTVKATDLVVEDMRIRYPTTTSMAPVTRRAVTAQQPVCPVCTCACPQCPDVVSSIKSSNAVPTFWAVNPTTTTPLATAASGNVPILPVTSIDTAPALGPTSRLPQMPPAVTSSQSSNPVGWPWGRSQNPVTPYMRHILQGALQNSGLGFLFNQPSVSSVNGPKQQITQSLAPDAISSSLSPRQSYLPGRSQQPAWFDAGADSY